MVTLSLIQIVFFMYYASALSDSVSATGPSTHCTVFAFRPDSKGEAHRWLTYAFVHAGTAHLLNNLLLQLIFGIPLEMAHGSRRILICYAIGVLAGSLGSSMTDIWCGLHFSLINVIASATLSLLLQCLCLRFLCVTQHAHTSLCCCFLNEFQSSHTQSAFAVPIWLAAAAQCTASPHCGLRTV